MNIAFLLRLWPIYGGGETVTRILANEFVTRGHSVHIIYFKPTELKYHINVSSNIQTHLISKVDCDAWHYNPTDAFKVKTTLYKIIEENTIDVLINQWWPYEYIQGIKNSSSVKIISVHHMNVFQKPILEGYSLKNIIKRLLGNIYNEYWMKKRAQAFIPLINESDKFVFLCDTFIKEFIQWSGYIDTNKKLAAIPNPQTYSLSVTEDILSQKKKQILFVGRIHDNHKRISLILQAWALIQNQAKDWELIIVGTGPDIEMLHNTAKRLNLERVSFEGQQDPLPYYQSASIFVMTSQREGWCMTLAESQQNGVACIAMDAFSALHEIITNKINGIIVPNGEIKSFSQAILYLINNPKERIRIAQNALQSCQSYSIEKIGDQWEQLFKSLYSNEKK